MMKALEKWMLLQDALPPTTPAKIAPTIEIRSNFSVMFYCYPIESNLSMLCAEIADALPTAEMIELMMLIVTMWPGSLLAVIDPELPPLKNRMLLNRIKQPPTMSSIEAGAKPSEKC